MFSSHRRQSRGSRRRAFWIEPLEDRRLLANLGLGIRLLADNAGVPVEVDTNGQMLASTLQGGPKVNAPFWVEIQVQDLRGPGATPAGIIGLPLNISWDPSVLDYIGSESPSNGSQLITSKFPLSRGLMELDRTAPAFIFASACAQSGLPDCPPGDQLDPFTNIHQLSGAAFPSIGGQGVAIGKNSPEFFSRLRFTAKALASNTAFTVNLAGSMSFDDGEQLENVVPLSAAPPVDSAVKIAPPVLNTVEFAFDVVNLVALSGVKFNDLDGDGTRDAGEPGAENFTIQLVDAVGTVLDTKLTDATGNYSFANVAPGNYRVREVARVGWQQTSAPLEYIRTVDGTANVTGLDFGNFQTITISGTKFSDTNGDGNLVGDPVFSSSTPDFAGRSLGFTIQLINSSDAVVKSITTNITDGTYRFEDVGPGAFRIREVVEAGFRQTAPALSNGQREYSVTTASGQNLTNRDFGNTKLTSLSGIKFNDRNGNGIRDADDAGQSNVTIELVIGATLFTTTTDANGNYSFKAVEPGNYIVREQVPARSIQTTLPTTYQVIVTSGLIRSDLNFGNFVTPTVSGTKFLDENGNGIRDVEDVVQSGVTIELVGPGQDSVIRSMTTTADGTYRFTDLLPGQYTVREIVPSGFIATLPASNNFTALSGEDRVFNFANRTARFASLSGSVYTDNNFNSIRDPSEFGLADWNIDLFDSAGNNVAHTRSAPDGFYQFDQLPPGTYRVVEQQEPGFQSASSSLGIVLPSGATRGNTIGLNELAGIQLAAGDAAVNYNFGEIVSPVTKRFFVSQLDVQRELNSSSGLRSQRIRGTNGDDTVVIEHLGDRVRVQVNSNAPQIILASDFDILLIDGGAGNDTLLMSGSASDETIRVAGDSVSLSRNGDLGRRLDILAEHFADMIVDGGDGEDLAVLEGSDSADRLQAAGRSATIESNRLGLKATLSGFDRIRAVSTDARDSAEIQAVDYVFERFGQFASG